MTTEAALIAKLRRLYLTQGRQESRNRLAANIDSSTVTVTFTYDLGRLVPGAGFSIGYEDFYAFATDTTAKSATVERGSDATTAAAHTAGDLVRVSPRYSDASIHDAIVAAMRELHGRGCFRMLTSEFTYNPSIEGYDLAIGDSAQVYDVQAQDYTAENWTPVEHARVERKQNTTDFASGVAVFLRGGAISGRLVHVRYRAPFASLTAGSTDVETDTGFPSRALELLEVTAAIGLLAGREAPRNFSEVQGPTRRSEEVPVGGEQAGLRPLLNRQKDLLANELRELAREYPYVRAR